MIQHPRDHLQPFSLGPARLFHLQPQMGFFRLIRFFVKIP